VEPTLDVWPKSKEWNRVHRTCPVCEKLVKHLKQHILYCHIPWYFSPHTACWLCRQQEWWKFFIQENHLLCEDHPQGTEFNDVHQWLMLMNGILYFFRHHFGGPDLKGLYQFVLPQQCYKTKPKKRDCTADIRDSEVGLLLKYTELNQLDDLRLPLRLRSPNCVAGLLHWRAIG
jgi:hypothetical protein